MLLKRVGACFLIRLAVVGMALSACGCSKPNMQKPIATFQSFKLVSGAGPCPPDRDCSGFIELSADGTLRVDHIGELPRGTVHQIKITPSELEAILPALTAPALKGLLDTGGQNCPVLYDVWESMSLTIAGGVHEHKTTGCSDQPILDARKAIMGLAKKYFPAYFSA